jgi:tetratricopeptide (TPR) repeat protein
MMTHTMKPRLHFRTAIAVVVATLGTATSGTATSGAQPPRSGPMQQGAQLDVQGRTAEARAVFQAVIDTASAPAAKAAAQRAIAMSYAFDGDCANTVKYETMVIAYWATREQAEPQNAFYQQGEMANEAARVCIDVGELDTAERWYRRGSELGSKEPLPATHSRALWEYRLAHALGRLAARRGNAAEARRHVATARRLLDADSVMRAQQERFFPYLLGYVALHTNDLKTAETQLAQAVATPGNQNDPFMRYLLALTYERQGRTAEANALYDTAFAMATAHNPPAAFVRGALRKQRGIPPG